nr:mediator of RNA polymerase II transcription subunit 8 isoform X1 [Ipomoea batatas]
MAAMEGVVGAQDQQPSQQPPARVVEKLNPAVQQQLNLESVKIRATSLFKAISRILEDFDAIARTNAVPKWQDILGQFSMVNLELFNIVEDIKKVSKAFVVHPKNVNAENAAILPVMLSSKLLPEMEIEDNSKREQLLLGMQNLSVASQIEKLKTRIDMIGAACESAEKVIADTRKAYFGTRQGPTILPTIDKAQAAKIQEQETLLRTAVNQGEGLRVPADQRQITSSLPVHLADILTVSDGHQAFNDSSAFWSTTHRKDSSFSWQKMMQLPQHQQQLLAQQTFRQSSMTGLNQNQLAQLHDLQQGQSQQKFQSPLGAQQFQGRQLASGAIQHAMSQNQLNQGNQLNRHLNQFSGPMNSALFNPAQSTPTSQMISNMPTMMSSQSLLPRVQFGMPGGNRTLAAPNLSDQMFNMGATNPGNMMQMQQQQQQHGSFGNMAQNLQQMPLQNVPQNHPSYQQQRPQGQQ